MTEHSDAMSVLIVTELGLCRHQHYISLESDQVPAVLRALRVIQSLVCCEC